ncbi:MAG: response regulator [Candidatus Saccharimonadales bacterium]
MTKILLVEDDINLREIYAARLGAEGYDIVTASDGEEALTKAVAEKPSVIVLDVMMPKISGFDVLDILRSTPDTKDAKVVMLSALSQETDKERGEKLGADKYLVKSQITLEDVVTTVKALVAQVSGDGGESSPAPVSDESPASNNPSSYGGQPPSSPQATDDQAAPSSGINSYAAGNQDMGPVQDPATAPTSNQSAQVNSIEEAISSQINPTNQTQPQQVTDVNTNNDQATDIGAATEDDNQSSLPTRLTATPDEIAEIEALVQSQNSDSDSDTKDEKDKEDKAAKSDKKTKKSKKEDKTSKKSSKKN